MGKHLRTRCMSVCLSILPFLYVPVETKYLPSLPIPFVFPVSLLAMSLRSMLPLSFALLACLPLFPQDSFDQFAQQTMPVIEQKDTAFTAVNAKQPTEAPAPMVRQKSSPGRPPSQPYTHGRKHSDTHGINKMKARKPLVEITVDSEDDKETAKRKKNTAAARKSRQRKQEHAEAAAAEIQRLRAIIYRLGADPDAESS